MTDTRPSADSPLVLVGAGKMGGALLAGWLEGDLDPAAVIVVDPSPPPDSLAMLKAAGVTTLANSIVAGNVAGGAGNDIYGGATPSTLVYAGGGYVGGDVKAPRVIMHDGAIVVGGLDMSAALSGNAASGIPKPADRPHLATVESHDEGIEFGYVC